MSPETIKALYVFTLLYKLPLEKICVYAAERGTAISRTIGLGTSLTSRKQIEDEIYMFMMKYSIR